MFGLEKENKTKKKKKEKGDFDLEQELLDKPSKAKECWRGYSSHSSR